MTKSSQPKTTTKTKSKPRKKNKKIKNEIYNALTPKNIICASIIGLLLAFVIIICNYCNRQPQQITDEVIDNHECFCNKATAPIQSKSKFKDINSEQLAHAQANGLKTIFKNKKHFESEINKLVTNKTLIKIKPNKYYNIRKLTHSYPYLIPEAKELLDLIGKRFQENLKAEGFPKYKFQISSLLRTIEFQKQLTKQNINATTDLSAHYYGTTFDIAYDKYDYNNQSYQNPKIEAILEKTLKELREECRMMIIRESSNKCFHITVVKKL